MNWGRVLRPLMEAAARRPLRVGLVVGLLAVAAAALALRLEPTTATGTLVQRGSTTWEATNDLHERFGQDAVYVLVREPVADLVLTSDLGRVLGLEGCLSGNRPPGQVPPGGVRGPCARLATTRPVQVVFGPGTFINEAVGQIQDQLRAQTQQRSEQGRRAAAAARKLALAQGRSRKEANKLAKDAESLVYAQAVRDAFQIATRYGISGVPRIDDPRFVSRIVFADTGPPGTPKARFAYLFPNRGSALVQIRLRPGLGDAEREQALRDIRAAVAMPQWRLANGRGTYNVTGAPVVLQDLSQSVSRSLVLLLVAALVVMAVVLALVFRTRRRLLPLAVALAAAALTFGGLSLLGASLTMASIAVLPILIGLAVDYAVQLQARIEEERGEGAGGTDGGPGGHRTAVARAARRGAPAVATAAAATAAGFLVLAFSPLPMIRGFGLLLVAGIALALTCALTLGVSGLAPAAGGPRSGAIAPPRPCAPPGRARRRRGGAQASC